MDDLFELKWVRPMDIIKGYKAFNADRTNRYGKYFKEGETYRVFGELSFGNKGNGFHMAKNLSDVFRYFDSEDICVAEVSGFGDFLKRDDEYYGYFDMYVVRNITVNKFLEREEIISRMLECKNDLQLQHFFQTFTLYDDEKLLFARQFRDNWKVMQHLLYYQYGFKDIYTYYPNDGKLLKIEKVINYGQDSNKRSKRK